MAEKPEDLNLPNSIIGKILKETLPEGVNIAKEARQAVSKAASIFILYATSSANNFSMKHKRKTLASQDVFSALEEMEFEQFIDPLKDCLEAYKQGQVAKKSVAEKRKLSKKKDQEEPPAKVPEQDTVTTETDTATMETTAETIDLAADTEDNISEAEGGDQDSVDQGEADQGEAESIGN